MADRFRELERPQAGRPKDIVLMATVSSFEGLRFPSRADLGRFAELFEPLYAASAEEARRQAVAALSRCPRIPERTALFVAAQPIGIAALFLTGAKAIGEDVLLRILETAGPDHARAIAAREALPDAVAGRLAGNRARAEREEALRDELRAQVRALPPREADFGREPVASPLVPADAMQQALMVRFARAGEAGMLAVTLCDALDASLALAERILADLSGRQLAETLLALAVPSADGSLVLSRLYPHLTAAAAGALLEALDPAQAQARVDSWRRADRYTSGLPANTQDTPIPSIRRAAG